MSVPDVLGDILAQKVIRARAAHSAVQVVVQQEVHCQSYWVIREVVVEMEKEPVECVFQNGPDDIAHSEAQQP